MAALAFYSCAPLPLFSIGLLIVSVPPFLISDIFNAAAIKIIYAAIFAGPLLAGVGVIAWYRVTFMIGNTSAVCRP